MSARVQPRSTPDLLLLGVSLVLLVLGVEMVYSASFVVAQQEFNDATYFLSKQVMWAVIGFVALVVLMTLDYHVLEKVALLLMLATVAAMLLVLVPGMGVASYGATRWLKLPGPLPPIQPSEFAKLALIIYMSHWLARKGARVREFTYGLIPFATILVAVTGLIMLQPDMGTSLVVVGTAACIFFAAGANLFHFVIASAGGVAAFAYLVMSEGYRSERLLAFRDPWADPQNTGWQTIQTLIALGSGGTTGLGLDASRQKFYWVPNAHTDAIFAIIGEELGLLGTAGVILLFVLFAWRGFHIAFRAPDAFGRLLATGVTCMVLVQAVMNMAVVTNTVPYTGITLPFVSFGGSSLLVCMAGVGVLLSVSRHETVPATVARVREPARPFQPRQVRGTVAASGTGLAPRRRTRARREA
ncbi:MAG TPA: putative lipid II flippase FtsW [Chloroflexota bacterium]|nr:putative lipid II flippase FtsW [Chloroflexota bacterium]